jgi:hypothetical protein
MKPRIITEIQPENATYYERQKYKIFVCRGCRKRDWLKNLKQFGTKRYFHEECFKKEFPIYYEKLIKQNTNKSDSV